MGIGRRCRVLLRLFGKLVVLGLLLGSPCPRETTSRTPSGGVRTSYTFTHQSDPQLGPFQQLVAGACGLPAVEICGPNPVLGTGIVCPLPPVIDPAPKRCAASLTTKALGEIAMLLRVDGALGATLEGAAPLGRSAAHSHAATAGELECAPRFLAGVYPFAGTITFKLAAGVAVERGGVRYTDEFAVGFTQELCVWGDHASERTKCTKD
jgi:hypothetical protein